MGVMGLDTTVRKPESKKEGECHRLSGLRAISLPKDRGKIEIKLLPSLNMDRTDGGYILSRFDKIGKDFEFPNITWCAKLTWGRETWPTLIIEFGMEKPEQFCSIAIKLARETLRRIGVEDPTGYHLAEFVVRHAEFVRFEGAWISLVRWLRIENRLPVQCFCDEDEISLASEAA